VLLLWMLFCFNILYAAGHASAKFRNVRSMPTKANQNIRQAIF
jgi:hypothetical protein